MKPIELERVEMSSGNSFTLDRYIGEHFTRQLHIHPEIEVVYIEQGEGLCVVADCSVEYRAGDIFIFCANLPHYFRRSESYHQRSGAECRSTYIQFREGILPADYLTMVGCSKIKSLLHKARRGVKLSLDNEHDMVRAILEMVCMSGFERLHHLYRLLDGLGAVLHEGVSIASESYVLARNSSDLSYYRIIEYINLNFREQVTLDQIAAYVGMNATSMCRYFKSKAGQSIFSYLMQVRMAIIKELLATTDTPIAQVAYSCGFNCISNFNNHFRRLFGEIPSRYREQMRGGA